jgi:peptide-methionine (S)-S-oxide reductase
MDGSNERAILAGGCFWGMQDLIRSFPGVIKTRVGYIGDKVANATYRNHEGHAARKSASAIPCRKSALPVINN